jgi:hypothetical protein
MSHWGWVLAGGAAAAALGFVLFGKRTTSCPTGVA